MNIVPLHIENVISIISVVGCLIFSLIKKERNLLVVSLSLAFISLYQRGVLDKNVKFLPDVKLNGHMNSIYNVFLSLENQIMDDLGNVCQQCFSF